MKLQRGSVSAAGIDEGGAREEGDIELLASFILVAGGRASTVY